ncbi:MAG: CTP synthase [Candidatus Diapherotrites archaeon]|nr:CTP synthase [Candidatus Diapherotrites archaeon]
MTRFIIVMGGVLSGVGKGIITSSIGLILKEKGFSVTAVKIDPYVNIDAGTMRPTEHGEVWVTPDGGEIDQDLGNYERFLNKDLSKDNNITTGKVYLRVIEKERKGDYLGTDVRVIPHVADEVKEMIYERAKGHDFCIVEIGGTTGDIENQIFLEAVRRIKWVDNKPVIYSLVAYLPVLKMVGEQKTKPAQHAIKSLMSIGIQPDFLFCRSEIPVDATRKRNFSYLASVKPENIISVPDLDSIYKVPLLLEEQDFGNTMLKHFNLPLVETNLKDWNRFVDRLGIKDKKVRIAIVGKYIADGGTDSHEDVYISVKDALVHAAAANDTAIEVEQVPSNLFHEKNKLRQFDGIIVPGGFGKTGIDGKLDTVKYCRENDVPYLGLCLGLQMAVIEYARNVCDLKDAHSTEMEPATQHPVVCFMPEQKDVTSKGGTMRLGNYEAKLTPGTRVYRLYEEQKKLNGDTVVERHRHRYEVNPEFVQRLEEKGLVFSGFYERADGQKLAEFIELPRHKFFAATQAHPEFTSRPGHPNPLFYGFIKACLK